MKRGLDGDQDYSATEVERAKPSERTKPIVTRRGLMMKYCELRRGHIDRSKTLLPSLIANKRIRLKWKTIDEISMVVLKRDQIDKSLLSQGVSLQSRLYEI